ncbi:MAG: helix-turn-helix domain-containing protein [Pseudomonadota bacterium]
MVPNRLREVREGLLISKSELASRAGVSALTVDRVEKGRSCRMDTKRKILLALGRDLTERARIFPEG